MEHAPASPATASSLSSSTFFFCSIVGFTAMVCISIEMAPGSPVEPRAV